MSNERALFVHSVDVVHMKPTEARLESILFYPNPYPTVHRVVEAARLADSNRCRSIGGLFNGDIFFLLLHPSNTVIQ